MHLVLAKFASSQQWTEVATLVACLTKECRGLLGAKQRSGRDLYRGKRKTLGDCRTRVPECVASLFRRRVQQQLARRVLQPTGREGEQRDCLERRKERRGRHTGDSPDRVGGRGSTKETVKRMAVFARNGGGNERGRRGLRRGKRASGRGDGRTATAGCSFALQFGCWAVGRSGRGLS